MMSGEEFMLELKDVSKEYKTKSEIILALDKINLKLNDNGLVFIVGESGCGKTTLINLIGGIDKATEGNILVNGKDISNYTEDELAQYRSYKIGFINQSYDLIEELNVFDNIKIALELQGIDDNQPVKEILEKFNLESLKKRKPDELSGGQRQRIAILRALVKKPAMILADEPTGNLDSKNSREIMKILKEISEKHLILVVSHDLSLAKEYADMILTIKDGRLLL